MKKLILLLAGIGLFFACGSKKEEGLAIKVKPETVELTGDMGECYKVVDKEYKSTKNSMFDILTLELERTDAELPFELIEGKDPDSYGTWGQNVYLHVGFGIEFLDKDGNVLESKPATADGTAGCYSREDPINLAKLKPGEKGTIRFTVDKSLKDAVSFRMSTAYEKVENTSSSSESSESTGSTDWDKVLDDYESMMNSYISAVKKSSQGDMSAMTEMANYLEKAESFASKLENAQDDMSSTQWARFLKIQEKMVKAASGL